MKSMMISVVLVLAMGCGKKGTPNPQGQAKAPSKPTLPDSKKGQSTPKKETPQPKPEQKAEAKKAGTVLWEFKTGHLVWSSPAVGADGTVYVGSGDNKVYALDGKTGDKKWEFKKGSGVTSSPVLGVGGTVYIGSNDKKLYALDGKSGAKQWEFETGSLVSSSPAVGTDGTVYVGSWDKVYAIKTDSKGPAKSPWPMRGQNAQHTGSAPKK